MLNFSAETKAFSPSARLRGSALLLLALVAGFGCGRSKAAPQVDEGPILKVRASLAQGNYEEALKEAKDISSQVPPGPCTEEALYLQGYILAYDKSDFVDVRLPLKQLLDQYPGGKYAASAQRLLADCRYWLGHYNHAMNEYKKLSANYPGRGLDGYALLQTAHCLLLNDKVGDALSAYREIVEKYPTDPTADWAQLMVANTYLKLQNYSQAKTELQKLMSFTQSKDVQDEAQKALRQLEAEEPFRKGVGVPE